MAFTVMSGLRDNRMKSINTDITQESKITIKQ